MQRYFPAPPSNADLIYKNALAQTQKPQQPQSNIAGQAFNALTQIGSGILDYYRGKQAIQAKKQQQMFEANVSLAPKGLKMDEQGQIVPAPELGTSQGGVQRTFAAVNKEGKPVFLQALKSGGVQEVPDYSPPTPASLSPQRLQMAMKMYGIQLMKNSRQQQMELANFNKQLITMATEEVNKNAFQMDLIDKKTGMIDQEKRREAINKLHSQLFRMTMGDTQTYGQQFRPQQSAWGTMTGEQFMMQGSDGHP